MKINMSFNLYNIIYILNIGMKKQQFFFCESGNKEFSIKTKQKYEEIDVPNELNDLVHLYDFTNKKANTLNIVYEKKN